VYSPRFSTGYFPQRNRFTVLVETHSWKDYATRVRVTRNTIVGLAELLAAHGRAVREQALQADRRCRSSGRAEVVLDYGSGWRETASGGGRRRGARRHGAHRLQGLRLYARALHHLRRAGDRLRPKTPQVWRVPFRDRVSPSWW